MILVLHILYRVPLIHSLLAHLITPLSYTDRTETHENNTFDIRLEDHTTGTTKHILSDSWFVNITQEQNSKAFIIKKVNNNMGSLLMAAEVWVFLNCHKDSPVNRASPFALFDLEPAGIRTVSDSCSSQPAQCTTERRRVLRSAMTFSKTCLKLRSV
jgi:hypothetical protein